MIKIVDAYNYDLIETGDFWLHRYSSAEYLEKTFNNGKFNLRFSTALNFEDPYEGWDSTNQGLKDAMDSIANYYNRTSKEAATVEGLKYVLLNVIKMHESETGRTSFLELVKLLKLFEDYNKQRNTTFISCWFKTKGLEEQNRAMWEIYGNNYDGVRVSVRWSDLKKELTRHKEKFDVGFVDYGNQNKIEDLFFVKDISYKHENEFRLKFTNKEAKGNYASITLNLDKIYCYVLSEKSRNDISNRLGNLGFQKNEDAKWVKKDSELPFESEQIDWSEVLDIINREVSQK